MALSPGTQRAASMAAGWLFVAGAGLISLLYFHELQQAARGLLGIRPSADAHAAARPRGADHGHRRRPGPSGRTAEIKAGVHGHYYASVEINGRPVEVMVDSGASIVALTYDDASLAGIHIRDSDYTQRANTANGVARIAPVMLDRVSIGEITVRDVPAAVSEPGKLTTSLLGMSFLSRLQRVDMRSGVLMLQE
jgi:aspartyl protease family protein